MTHHIVLIGEPVRDPWWHRNVESGFISVGFDGNPQKARGALLSFAEGDWIYAYAKPFGYVGAGVAGSPDSYKFVGDSELPSDFESTHRHFRSVDWRYVIPTLADAVKWQDAGRRPPPTTVQAILDAAIGERVLQAIAQRAQVVAPYLLKCPPLQETSTAATPPEDDEADLGEEDLRRVRIHKKVERNPELATRAKRIHGYTCKACNFDFRRRYGEIGKNFIEAHHLVPLSQLKGRVLRLDPRRDFTVLCSNCHRMIHRSLFVGDIEQFRIAHVPPNEP